MSFSEILSSDISRPNILIDRDYSCLIQLVKKKTHGKQNLSFCNTNLDYYCPCSFCISVENTPLTLLTHSKMLYLFYFPVRCILTNLATIHHGNAYMENEVHKIFYCHCFWIIQCF